MRDEPLPPSPPASEIATAEPAAADRAVADGGVPRRPEWRFLASALALGLGFIGLFRVPWVQSELLIPFARGQQKVAGWALGLERLPVVVDFSCTGADVMALCLAAVLAFPAALGARLRGAAIGLALIAALNTARIGTLSLAVGDRVLFDRLHLLVWPAILIIVVALYVFSWMRSVRSVPAESAADGRPPLVAPPLRRFAAWLVGLTILYVAGAGWYLESAWLREAAAWAAALGGGLMRVCGVAATVRGNTLATANGGFVVTTTCIATPLVPVYLAAVLALPMTRWRRVAWLLAAPPLFFVLGTARLLTLALPAQLVPSPSIAIHAFNQLVFAALLVVAAAVWSARGAAAPRALVSLFVGLLAGVAVGVPWTWALDAMASAAAAVAGHDGHRYVDPQGAIRLLPAFQLALFAALASAARERIGAGWRRLAAAGSLLAALQVPFVVAVGELRTHAQIEPHVRDLRAWAVVAPVLLLAVLAGGFGWIRRRGRPAPAARPQPA